MATEKTDVVIVGVGAAGGILAAELGKAGMKVIGLERGPRLKTADFSPHDELRYFQRQELRPNPKRMPVTWRPNTSVRANPLPILNKINGKYDGPSSNLVMALNGDSPLFTMSDPNAPIGQMPYNGPYMSADQIGEISAWITAQCPE